MSAGIVRATIVALLTIAAQAGEAGWWDHVAWTFGGRLRAEGVDYFRPPDGAATEGAPRYGFLGSQLRAGLRLTFPHAQVQLELQDTRLLGLPRDASLPPPIGNLGPGATYFAHTPRSDQGALFLKQAHVTFRRSGFSASVGRFEYSDGLETVSPDPSLAWLKRSRLGERLVGPFGYTHVTRSFDGIRVAFDRPAWNATAFASHPTHGGYEVGANPDMAEVDLAGLAVTVKQLTERTPADVRVFYLYFGDGRTAAVKVDNRTAAIRSADKDPIRVHTVGGHAATVLEAGPGTVDALAWGAFQSGSWGVQDHGGWAQALEAGYQLPRLPWAPWVRVGLNRASGDADPTDGDHQTFFQLIPTPRIYAQFPFFNLMNNEDAFVQVLLKPHARVLVRGDCHWLRLTEPSDLWYAGGGATNERIFGFSGTPSGTRRQLARLADLSLSIRLGQRVTAYAYFGRTLGRGVVANTFAGRKASYGYLELAFRR